MENELSVVVGETQDGKGPAVRMVRRGTKQLVMRICVRGSDGMSFRARALLDTGAQVNLLRRGLRDHLVVPSKERLQLVKADVRRLEGGDKRV